MRQTFAHRAGRQWHPIVIVAVCMLAAACASADPLTEGARLFDDGNYAEAAQAFEATEGDVTPSDLLKYNAGVAYLTDGKFDDGVKRLEDVAVRDGGELRRAALFNLGHAWFHNAHTMAHTTEEDAQDQDPLETLTQAAVGYRTAVDFYRMIRPEDEETRRNITIAKTALRAVVDRIVKIEESRRKQADQDALKEPAKLLFELMGQQRLYRAITWALEAEPQRHARLASRRLRRSVAEARDRAEMLRRYLAQYSGEPADASGGSPAAPQADADLVARHRQAAIPLGESIDIQANAEGSLAELDFARASQQHTDAIRKMRDAIPLLPLDLGLVIGDALSVASQNLAATQTRVEPATSQPTATSQPADADDLYANVVGDDVLAPVARVVSPNDLAQAQRLADTQEDVVWSTAILTQIQPPAPPATDPNDPNAPAQPAGPLDAETIEKIRTLAQQATRAATQAHSDLQAGHMAESLDDQKACVEALRAIADLLPKPPKSPADIIREILQRQQAVRQGIDSLADMTDGRDEARQAMAQSQTADAQQANELASQLQASQDENQRNAGTLTGQAGEHLDQSSKSLNDDRADAAAEQTDRAIETLTKALDALSGKNNEQDKDDQQQNQQQQQQDQKKQDQQQQNQSGQGYQLTPRQARMLMEELDRKRREEEKAIMPADSGITVTKDW